MSHHPDAPTLFDPPAEVEALARDVVQPRAGAARSDDPTTSKRAARNVMPRTGSQRAKVLLVLAAAPYGCTSDHVCEALGDRNGSSWRSRLVELRDDFDPPLATVSDTDTRATRSGEQARVWTITERGLGVAGMLEDEAFAEAG